VLEYSIRRHASISVEVSPIHEDIARAGIRIPDPVDEKTGVEHRFRSAFRDTRVVQFQGKAIYLDSDMLVLRDIKACIAWR